MNNGTLELSSNFVFFFAFFWQPFLQVQNLSHFDERLSFPTVSLSWQTLPVSYLRKMYQKMNFSLGLQQSCYAILSASVLISEV